jgi:hypothetical protein
LLRAEFDLGSTREVQARSSWSLQNGDYASRFFYKIPVGLKIILSKRAELFIWTVRSYSLLIDHQEDILSPVYRTTRHGVSFNLHKIPAPALQTGKSGSRGNLCIHHQSLAALQWIIDFCKNI